jgi:trans-aconitate methyltransferase
MTSTTIWNPENYERNARFVSDLGAPLLELLQPKAGETILDLGCGDGFLTAKVAAAGCLVIGADASRDQVEAARRRGVCAVVMDGHGLGLKQRFDAVFSNAALHWMKRANEVAADIVRCLRPGGRFIAEFGGKGNVEKIRSALHNGLRQRAINPWLVDPWYYPAPEEYEKILQDCGLRVSYIESIPRPTRLPGDILAWLEVFAQPFTQAVQADERRSFLCEIRDRLEPELRQADGTWIADYVRLRLKAVKDIEADSPDKPASY